MTMTLIAETGPGGALRRSLAACWLLGSTQPRPAHRACSRSRIKTDSDSPSHWTMSVFSHRGTCYRTPKRNRVTPHYLPLALCNHATGPVDVSKERNLFPGFERENFRDSVAIPRRFLAGTRNDDGIGKSGIPIWRPPGDGGLEIPEIPIRPGSRE
jgi:hypothetical protein